MDDSFLTSTNVHSSLIDVSFQSSAFTLFLFGRKLVETVCAFRFFVCFGGLVGSGVVCFVGISGRIGRFH